jgi:hypothetical protein
LPSVGSAEQRGVGIGYQRIDVGRVLGIDRRRRWADGICWPHLERCHDARAGAWPKPERPGLLTGRQDEGEFVAAHAGNEGVVGGMLQAPRNGAEQLVADDVTEQVVGLLEVIEVDRQKRKARAVLFGLGESLSDLPRQGRCDWADW